MEPNEIFVDWINDIALTYIPECKVSNDGKHEINQH